MCKRAIVFGLLLMTFPLVALSQQPVPPKTHLQVGQSAPDFILRDTEGKEVKLTDFRGKKNVVLAFYVLAFTGG